MRQLDTLTAKVWGGAPVDGTKLLVLLAIARSAEQDGGQMTVTHKELATLVRVSQVRLMKNLDYLINVNLITAEFCRGYMRLWINEARFTKGEKT